ncbi:hypothetical protein CCUS01_16357, partial [Colletotrichum cuscutae]
VSSHQIQFFLHRHRQLQYTSISRSFSTSYIYLTIEQHIRTAYLDLFPYVTLTSLTTSLTTHTNTVHKMPQSSSSTRPKMNITIKTDVKVTDSKSNDPPSPNTDPPTPPASPPH